uniref:Mesoderm development candidate 2 n=1 Tax=Rhizochromulina marina TaxID=1034831 RepID=A0A7S2RHB1_9STRA
MRGREAVVLALLALLALAWGRSSKDWGKVDFDALEEEWKYGDEEDELITDDELLFREMQRRREQGIDIKNLDVERVKHQQSMAGPTMMFIELRPREGGYAEEELYNITGIWKDLMYTGGLTVTFFNIENDKVLCSMQKGWDGIQVKEFLLTQSQVAKVTWDNQDYVPEGYDSSPPPRGESAGKAKEGKEKNDAKTKKKKTTRRKGNTKVKQHRDIKSKLQMDRANKQGRGDGEL